MKAYLFLEKMIQAGIVFGFGFMSSGSLLKGDGDWLDVVLVFLAGFWLGVILMNSLNQKQIKSLEEEIEHYRDHELGRLR